MRVIARPALREFQAKHPDSAAAIETWYRRAIHASWQSTQDVKAVNRSADFLSDNRVAFNLGGNNYRLIVKIDYESSVSIFDLLVPMLSMTGLMHLRFEEY